MENLSLYDMGKQYAAEADNLEEMIAACRERKRLAMRCGNSPEAHRQERLIELHTQQRNDIVRISVWLRNYYHKKGETNEKHQSDAA